MPIYSSVSAAGFPSAVSRRKRKAYGFFTVQFGTVFDEVLGRINRMIADFAAFSGMEMENMTRGHAWRFLDTGRRLERALNLLALVSKAVSQPHIDAMLQPLLEVADSTMTYRRRHFARPSLPLVLDLLLADATNARSLAFQVDALSVHMQQLPHDPKAPSPTQEERLIARVAGRLRDADLDVLGNRSPAGDFGPLLALLGTIQDDLEALSDAITHYYFAHGEQRVS